MICKSNQILRSGYIRKTYTRKSGTKVKGSKVTAGCIKDRGNDPRLIPKLKKGTLTQFGYTTKKTDIQRHNALKKALKKLRYASVIHKLNAVKVLTKNTNPTASNTFDKDIKWLENK